AHCHPHGADASDPRTSERDRTPGCRRRALWRHPPAGPRGRAGRGPPPPPPSSRRAAGGAPSLRGPGPAPAGVTAAGAGGGGGAGAGGVGAGGRKGRDGMTIAFKGRVFSVEIEQVRLPDGRQYQLETVRHRPSVVLLPMKDERHVILIRQFRFSVGRELWE